MTSNRAANTLFLPLGILFGFLLSRAGATTYDFYAGLFLFEDLQLFWIIAVAALVGVIGLAAMERFQARTLLGRGPMDFSRKPMRRGLVVGSLMFGLGWGLAGACPGTALAMLGEGKMAAGFVIVGILLGTYAYGRVVGRAPSKSESPSSVFADAHP